MVSKVIAIDGPCGGGKSTMAKMVAERLGVIYIDTGAMYRALGLILNLGKISFENNEAVSAYLQKISFDYMKRPGELVVIDGVDYSLKIREHHVSTLASQVSKSTVVRKYLLSVQRSLASEKFCIMEGRDIGTVVFPDSFCKIYLTADINIRAKRRLDELKAKGDNSLTLLQVEQDVKRRDDEDMNRSVAPLKKADDAILVDTSALTHEEVIHKIIEIAKDQAKRHSFNL